MNFLDFLITLQLVFSGISCLYALFLFGYVSVTPRGELIPLTEDFFWRGIFGYGIAAVIFYTLWRLVVTCF